MTAPRASDHSYERRAWPRDVLDGAVAFIVETAILVVFIVAAAAIAGIVALIF